MGDRCYAQLTIGGEIPEELLDELAQELKDDDLMNKEDKLSHYLSNDYLCFEDHEVNYGKFDIQEWLEKNEIEYDNDYGPGGEYGEGLDAYRKGGRRYKAVKIQGSGIALEVNSIHRIIEMLKDKDNLTYASLKEEIDRESNVPPKLLPIVCGKLRKLTNTRGVLPSGY
ncbi:MAG: hypothetical protein KKD44_28185 [Proteobacteria bacterium]|nr:hypothetical protein [Pseudomonadota bacterium]